MRLTQETRKWIEKAVIEHRFAKDMEALKNSFALFASDLYESRYPEEHRRLMHQCPEDWFVISDELYFEYQGWHKRVNLVAALRQPYIPRYLGTKPLPSGLARRYGKLMELEKKLLEDIENAKLGVRAVLNSVTTTERLLKVWPEVAPFMPAEPKQPTLALAIPINDLNTTLGLP